MGLLCGPAILIVAGQPVEDGAELTAQRRVDLAALAAGGKRDALDKARNGFGCLMSVLRAVEASARRSTLRR